MSKFKHLICWLCFIGIEIRIIKICKSLRLDKIIYIFLYDPTFQEMES